MAMKTRKGDCIQTFSGQSFWPLDPREEEICLEDIAHSLSRQCRFAGHTRKFYSVAQHSVFVSRIVPGKDALWGLLHDASEAYLVDLPRPIKHHKAFGRGYVAAERRIMQSVCRKFGLPEDMPESVRVADDLMLSTEIRDLLNHPDRVAGVFLKPLDISVSPVCPDRAEKEFLDRAHLILERI
jgi:uncharacterized protein